MSTHAENRNNHHSHHKIAVLIDGSFFLKRYRVVYPGGKSHSPKEIVEELYTMAMKHVGHCDLHRILYYDCQPLEKRVHNPISKKNINFSDTKQYRERIAIFGELKKRRKVTLRLGEIKDNNQWIIRPQKTKDLLKSHITIDQLSKDDVTFQMRQKGVDIKIGLDIASIAYKGLANQIILVSGDSDFVPAAKLARREGMDFILDPMWNPIDPNLYEHIDGLKSYCPKPKSYHSSR